MKRLIVAACIAVMLSSEGTNAQTAGHEFSEMNEFSDRWSCEMQKKDFVKIGVMFAASGPFAGYGHHGRQAVELAVEEINAKGGINGKKVEFVFGDDSMKAATVKALARQFISTDRVDFLMGPTSSGLAAFLSDSAKAHKIPLILTQAADPTLTGSAFHPYVFATLSNAMMHSRSGAYVAEALPYKNWMTIYPNYSYGISSWNMFIQKLQQLRSDITIAYNAQTPPLGCTDYSAYIDTIAKVKPEAVWAPLWGSDAVNFIKQALTKYPEFFSLIRFMIPDGASLEILNPVANAMPSGILVSSRYYFASPETEENAAFIQSYKSKFGEMPDYMAEETYAGVYFIKAAAERAQSTNAREFVQAVEKEPLAWNTPEGWKIMRKEDHQAVEDVLWGQTVYTLGDPIAKIIEIQSIQGEMIVRTPEELAAIPRPEKTPSHFARR